MNQDVEFRATFGSEVARNRASVRAMAATASDDRTLAVAVSPEVMKGIFARNVLVSDLQSKHSWFPYSSLEMKGKAVPEMIVPHRMLIIDILSETQFLLSNIKTSIIKYLQYYIMNPIIQ